MATEPQLSIDSQVTVLEEDISLLAIGGLDGTGRETGGRTIGLGVLDLRMRSKIVGSTQGSAALMQAPDKSAEPIEGSMCLATIVYIDIANSIHRYPAGRQ